MLVTVFYTLFFVPFSSQVPPEFVSSSSKLLVHFKTDDTIFEKGFAVIYGQVGADFVPPTLGGAIGHHGSRSIYEPKTRKKSTPSKKQHHFQSFHRTPPLKLT